MSLHQSTTTMGGREFTKIKYDMIEGDFEYETIEELLIEFDTDHEWIPTQQIIEEKVIVEKEVEVVIEETPKEKAQELIYTFGMVLALKVVELMIKELKLIDNYSYLFWGEVEEEIINFVI